MLMKHKRLEHRTPTEQKILDFYGLEKCDDLVKDVVKEKRHLSLPKVQFAFKSTRPPRNPQKNKVDISDDYQQNMSSDTQHEDTSLSDPNGKQIFIKSCLNPDIFYFQCILCRLNFLEKKLLKEHFQIHNGTIPTGLKKAYLKRKVSPHTLTKQERNETHDYKEHILYTIYIPQSPSVTTKRQQKDELTTKYATNSDNVIKIIICDMCSKSYPDINEFSSHMNSHSLYPLSNPTTWKMAVKSTKFPTYPQAKMTETMLAIPKVKHSDHTEISSDESNLPQGSLN